MNNYNILGDSQKEASDMTQFLLKSTARRLSGRPSLRHARYKIIISKGVPQSVKVEPAIYVFPTVYHKKFTDRIPVFQYILEYYLGDSISYKYGDDGSIVIINGGLLPGTYVYEGSVDNRRRRWVRISEE